MKWFGRSRKSSSLASRLADYPAYAAPHTGDHLAFSDAQALENLDYLKHHRSERIRCLQQLLGEYAIDLTPVLEGGEYRSLIEALYAWAQREWPQAVDSQIATRAIWRQTDRQDKQIIYSLIMDCAIVLGDIIAARRSAFEWDVDLDPVNIRDEMPTARRVVLKAPSLLHPAQSVIIDCEQIVAAILIKPQSAANRAINLWLRVCDEAVSGATQGESVGVLTS